MSVTTVDEQFSDFLDKLSKNIFHKENNDLKKIINDGKFRDFSN